MMVLVSNAAVAQLRGEGLVQHLVERFEFPHQGTFELGQPLQPVARVHMHCGGIINAPLEVIYDFIGNLTHLCENCRVAWHQLLPDADHVRVATDILQERGVALDETFLQLMIGKPQVDGTDQRLMELREAQSLLARQVAELTQQFQTLLSAQQRWQDEITMVRERVIFNDQATTELTELLGQTRLGR